MITKDNIKEKRYLVCTNVLKENCLKHNFSFDTLKSVLSVINNSLNKGLGHHIGWDLKKSNIYNVFDNVWKSIRSNIMQDFNLKSTGHMGTEQLS